MNTSLVINVNGFLLSKKVGQGREDSPLAIFTLIKKCSFLIPEYLIIWIYLLHRHSWTVCLLKTSHLGDQSVLWLKSVQGFS